MRWVCLFFLLSTLISCTEISFKEPQPKGIKKLTSFPSALQGKYIVPDDSSSRKPDTLIITNQWYRISGGSERADWFDKGSLSDTLVLKKYKGYYFFNFYVEKQWILRTFKQEKNGDIILFDVSLTDEQTMRNLNAKLHPEVIKEDSDTFYKVDPQPKQLLDFILVNYKPQPPLRKIK